MGLIRELDLPIGISCPQAYYKIKSVKTDYQTGRAWLALLVYYNKAARDSGKDPIFITDDYRVYNTPKLVQNQAIYCVYVPKVAYGSGLSMTITPDIGAPSVTVTEGKNLTIVGLMTMDEQINAIMDAIKADVTFSANWDVMYNPNMMGPINGTQCFCIISKATGIYAYAKGNNLTATGDMVSSIVKKTDGINTTIGDFDMFYGSKAVTLDPRQQSYKYLKTLSEFNGCYDD